MRKSRVLLDRDFIVGTTDLWDGSGNLHRFAEWSFCLTAARVAAEQGRR